MTLNKDTEERFEDNYGSFQFSNEVHKPGLLKLKQFLASEIELAERRVLEKYQTAFSQILENEYVGKEEAVLKAESAWHELLKNTEKRAIKEFKESKKYLDLAEKAWKYDDLCD